MRLSRYFLPTLKENPAEAQIVSHRLMLRAGLVRQTAAGIYAWLPLGLAVLRNIERNTYALKKSSSYSLAAKELESNPSSTDVQYAPGRVGRVSENP